MNREEANALLRTMVEIPSPSGDEARLATYLADVMSRSGMTSHVDEAGNAIGEIDRGDGPQVLLLGHMDTVPGDLPVRLEDDRLYGRGTVDAKGPLATMICAATLATGFRGRIVVAGAVEEETPGSRGAIAIRATRPEPDLVIIGEPSGWDCVVLGYKGRLDLDYRVECPPTHPSNPEPKASELVVAGWTALTRELGADASHASFDRPGATLTSFGGDIVTAEARFTVRTPTGFDDADLVRRLRARLSKGDLTVVNSVPACRADRNNLAVRALTRAIRAEGARPRLKLKTGTSDMNTLCETWAAPMATYGPGDSRLDHSTDEHIPLDDYFRGISVLTGALNSLAETSQ
jgi:LysW-gamma-L-lysine carboxypeptidase